jgi:hypothetical protein
MDPILTMFGCLICTMTGLVFIEVRRIRKNLERVSPPSAETSATKTAVEA